MLPAPTRTAASPGVATPRPTSRATRKPTPDVRASPETTITFEPPAPEPSTPAPRVAEAPAAERRAPEPRVIVPVGPCATFQDFRRDYCHQLLDRLAR